QEREAVLARGGPGVAPQAHELRVAAHVEELRRAAEEPEPGERLSEPGRAADLEVSARGLGSVRDPSDDPPREHVRGVAGPSERQVAAEPAHPLAERAVGALLAPLLVRHGPVPARAGAELEIEP